MSCCSCMQCPGQVSSLRGELVELINVNKKYISLTIVRYHKIFKLWIWTSKNWHTNSDRWQMTDDKIYSTWHDTCYVWNMKRTRYLDFLLNDTLWPNRHSPSVKEKWVRLIVPYTLWRAQPVIRIKHFFAFLTLKTKFFL